MGNLNDYIKHFGRVEEAQANLWFFQLTSAIRYLHLLNLAHRDLKCENLLISQNCNLKVADFGFARRDTTNDKGDEVLLSDFSSSLSCSPPEICEMVPYFPKKANIWSMGVMLIVMLYGAMPFKKTKKLIEDKRNRHMQIDPEITKILSSECRDVIYTCLTPDADLRPNIEQVYNMKWLEQRIQKYINLGPL